MKDLISKCAQLSELAYRKGSEGDTDWERELDDRLPDGYKLLEVYDHGGTQGYLAFKDGTQYLVFRGTDTDNLTDITHDLYAEFDSVDSKARQAHAGFLLAWRAIRDEVMDSVDKAISLVICGHSLGGAVATLAAYDMRGSHFIEGVVTFGAPKVGNKLFSKHYNNALGEITVRVVRGADKVPRVYSQWWLGMTHAGNNVYYIDHLNNGTMNPTRLAITWCRAGLLLLSFLNLLRGRWSDVGVGIKHHSMREYRRLVSGSRECRPQS